MLNINAIQKERELFSEAFLEYEKYLAARAYFKTNNKSTVEDLVQATFLKAWSYVVKGGKIDKMKTFLYHILNNLIIDEYRKYKMLSLDLLIEKGGEPSVDDSGRLFDIADGKRLLLRVDELPKKYREVISLKYKQSLSLEEISEITNRSKNTVSVQIHRGVKKLKALVAEN